jgi:mono/diheme cytochrome c family protein
MFRRILKWTGLTLLLIIIGVSVSAMFRQHLTYNAPYPEIRASKDTAVIATGKQLVLFTKGCVYCHSPVNNIDSIFKLGQTPSLAGARRMDTPFGTFFSPNLTPDAKTGIGNMTDAALARMFRYGVKKNGEAVLPFMQGFNLNDAEITAVISYLRSLQPVENKVPEHEFSVVGKFAKAYAVKPMLP